MQLRTPIFILLCLIVLFNCKSAKKVTTTGTNYNLSTKQLIKENTKQSPQFSTIKSTLKINYVANGSSQTYSVSFRAKKDEAIWISAPFSVVKALVTPNKVSFYNKLDKTYFEGDYAYLSKLLGTELDFKKVQNILTGDAIFQLKGDTYKSTVQDSLYVLQPKKQPDLFEIFFLLDPSNFKVKSQQISQAEELRHLQIDYKSYQQIENEILPQKVKVIAVEKKEELIINLEFKNTTLNEALRFPFKIPSGYKAIEL